ncbi:M14 family zinc carboxypeptidase [Ornithinimicrobium avium]|uniref:Peptidase M14 n=1 Tax=Ornithinimicrobium avium TaxID=2283195 RepID=A0A345NQN7_9MICO|nr:M14 family zinc carboxypeptidase [Ornithinimicrobium avium]AXH97345.1 peptidase M14 [Ornithinimicrobium avium]
MSHRTPRRAALGVATATIALSLAVAPAATSAPGNGKGDGNGKGGPAANITALERQDARGPKAATPGYSGVEMPAAYPHQPTLRVFPHDPDDRSYSGDLVGYADLAPWLNDLMSRSDRVSAQVVGRSTLGRDLYLVTVTAPEKANETRKQTAYREMIQNEPHKAARDKKLKAEYKTPIWFSANIHGNEWEGTDASMQFIEELATAPRSDVADLLDGHRLYFSLTLNPDGRNLGQRVTALGFDPNRDMITNTNPESESYVRLTQSLLPINASDLHGYTGNLQVEPTGPPHGENYEYDLFIPHNYAMALQIEQDVVDAAIEGNPLTAAGGIKIPYRDTPSGWDDYPPIFTAQYAAFYGALTSTVELPLSRDRSTGVQTPERAAINVEVALQVLRSTVDYVHENDGEILANQIEFFDRALSGEEKTALTVDTIDGVAGPEQWKPLWDVADDQDPVDLPQAYVIPVGEGQRSLSDATSLVEQLLLHDIEVRTLNNARTIDGTTYPRGSYVIDMAQSKRALANALLDLGSDISAKVPSMYDISAWSYSYLWGATVDKVGDVGDGPVKATKAASAPTRQASVPKRAQHVTFDVAGVEDYVALNDLLAQDAVAWLLPSGQAVVAPESHGLVVNAALEHDIAFRAATAAEVGTVTSGDAKELDEVRVGYVGTQDPRTSLEQLGFDAVEVSAASIDADQGILDDLDVIWLSSALNFTNNQVNGRDATQAWLDEGHALVGSGSSAFTTARNFGLVSATAVSGQSRGNGIVAVDTPADSLLANYGQDYAFVYPAQSYTDLGEGTRAEQFYGEGNPLLSGHWRGDGTASPQAAAGNAAVISGESAAGGKAVVFGTSPFYRTHPKGGMSQVAQAIFAVTPEG